MKYAALLKGVAKQLGYQVLWSPPQVVNGSINPPPTKRYPGLKCYMVQVRVGPREYSGFGPTAVSARHFAESQAYLDLYFQLTGGRGRESESDSLQPNSKSSSQPSSVDTSGQGRDTPLSTHKNDEEDDLFMNRFAQECRAYFAVARERRPGRKNASVAFARMGPNVQSSSEITCSMSSDESQCCPSSSLSVRSESESCAGDCGVQLCPGTELITHTVNSGQSVFQQPGIPCLAVANGDVKEDIVTSVQDVPIVDQRLGQKFFGECRKKSNAGVVQNFDSLPDGNTVAQNSDSVAPIDSEIAQSDDNVVPVVAQSGIASTIHPGDSNVQIVETSSQQSIRDNPIGQLQELLMQAKLPLPTYSMSIQQQSGGPVFHCVVIAKGFMGSGVYIPRVFST